MTILTSFTSQTTGADAMDTLNNMLARLLLVSAPLKKIAAGVTQVQSGGARSVIPIIGDSVTAGWGANSPTGTGSGGDAGGTGSNRRKAWPRKLASALSAAGIPTRADAFFPCIQSSNTIAQIAAANENTVTFGSDWATFTGAGAISGGFVQCASGTTSLVYTPEFNADTFNLFITGASGLGTFTVTDASGTLATVDETVTNLGVQKNSLAYRVVTVTRASPSLAPISIQRTGTGGTIYISAIIPFDTTSPRVELLNMGWPGSKTSDWTSTDSSPWTPGDGLGIFSGLIDGVLVELGINDASNSVSASTYQANLQTIADKMGAYGDVLLVKPHKALSQGSAGDIPSAYLSAINAVQTNKNAAMPINYNALSLVTADYYDNVHLAEQGYGKEATAALSGFKASVGVS